MGGWIRILTNSCAVVSMVFYQMALVHSFCATARNCWTKMDVSQYTRHNYRFAITQYDNVIGNLTIWAIYVFIELEFATVLLKIGRHLKCTDDYHQTGIQIASIFQISRCFKLKLNQVVFAVQIRLTACS